MADDIEGNLICSTGDTFPSLAYPGFHWAITRALGSGVGGRVYCVEGRLEDTAVAGQGYPPLGQPFALKVVRNHPAYSSQGSMEVHLLRLLMHERDGGRRGLEGVVHLVEHFSCHGHLCLVEEWLPGTLLDALRAQCFQGLPLPSIAAIMRQLCTTLHALHTVGLMHADVKPENIMLCGPGGEALLQAAPMPVQSSGWGNPSGPSSPLPSSSSPTFSSAAHTPGAAATAAATLSPRGQAGGEGFGVWSLGGELASRGSCPDLTLPQSTLSKRGGSEGGGGFTLSPKTPLPPQPPTPKAPSPPTHTEIGGLPATAAATSGGGGLKISLPPIPFSPPSPSPKRTFPASTSTPTPAPSATHKSESSSSLFNDLMERARSIPPPTFDARKALGVKLVDFGSSGFETHSGNLVTYIQTRFYRAPEVMLGIPYTGAVDLWSAGCLAMELWQGLPLFPGVDEHDVLGRMQMILGHPPEWMMNYGECTRKFFALHGGGGGSGSGSRAPSSSLTPPSAATVKQETGEGGGVSYTEPPPSSSSSSSSATLSPSHHFPGSPHTPSRRRGVSGDVSTLGKSSGLGAAHAAAARVLESSTASNSSSLGLRGGVRGSPPTSPTAESASFRGGSNVGADAANAIAATATPASAAAVKAESPRGGFGFGLTTSRPSPPNQRATLSPPRSSSSSSSKPNSSLPPPPPSHPYGLCPGITGLPGA